MSHHGKHSKPHTLPLLCINCNIHSMVIWLEMPSSAIAMRKTELQHSAESPCSLWLAAATIVLLSTCRRLQMRSKCRMNIS